MLPFLAHGMYVYDSFYVRGVQTFGVSGPQWKKKSCLGPHIKYIEMCNHKKICIMF